MQRAGSTKLGYLVILLAGLLLSVGVRYEAKRQYLDAWQQYLEDQKTESKEFTKRVSSFFTILNDNLGTLSLLPDVRKIDRYGDNLGADGKETIQQVYNKLAKNIAVARVHIVQVNFDATKRDLATGTKEQPALTLYGAPISYKTGDIAPISAVGAEQAPARLPEYQEIQRQLKWLGVNYPSIQRVKTAIVPMTSGREIAIDGGDSVANVKPDSGNGGLVFSVPFFDRDGVLAGSVSAIVPSRILRAITVNEHYSLISPLAEYMSAPIPRDRNIRLMLHAADRVPAPSTTFSETVAVDTNDARGRWQLNMRYPAANYYTDAQFRANRTFEHGAYLSLALLTLLGLGWHRSNVRSSIDMQESAKALQRVNDDITRLNVDLAESMKRLHEAQEEIIKKGRLAQMGQLVATVAHELRNPLSSVRTSAFLLRRKLADVAVNVEAQLQRIDNSVSRCDAVITQFLDYARSRQLEYKEADFDNWVVKLVEEEAQKLPAAVALECDLGLNGKIVSFDPGRLSRALINLMSNASEAMVGKGDDPSKFTTQDPKITILTRQNGQRIEIEVRDNGPGIAEELVEKILEPLFTTKSFGTGLGLPAVVQVLEQHGGGLDVKGGLGAGAAFTAWIPLTLGQVQAA